MGRNPSIHEKGYRYMTNIKAMGIENPLQTPRCLNLFNAQMSLSQSDH